MDMLFLEHTPFMLFVRTERRSGTENGLAAFRAAVSGINIIVVTDVVEMAALATVPHGDDFFRAHGLEILVQLRHADFVYAMSDIRVFAIEEQARVIVEAFHLLHLPLAFRVGGGQQEAAAILHLFVVESHEMQVELAVAVTQAGCPLPSGIMVPPVRKVIGIRVGNLLQRVGTIFPVHQVFRLQDGRAGEEIHGRSHQIIGIIHADYVRVREVGVDNRIDKGPLPVVG